jgi:hypothetical protein
MSQSIRDKIRAATVGKKVNLRTKVFNYEGVDIEFRAPNLKVRRDLLNKSKGDNGELDMIEFIVQSVILCSFVPGTIERVFEESDRDVLLNQSTGSFVDIFGGEIAQLMVVEQDVKN